MKKTRLVLVLVAFVLLLSFLPLPAHAQNPVVDCTYKNDVAAIINQITQNGVAQWIRDLSGEDTVMIDGHPFTIRTRYTTELFNPLNRDARAYPYLRQELTSFGYVPGVNLEDHDFSYTKIAPKSLDPEIPDPAPIEINLTAAKNLVVTIPGHGPNANQQVLMTAHLDSTTNWDGDPRQDAPGAEDNASGVTALLEAARLFRYYRFDRTIKLIFFTAEEQGLLGSEAYVDDHRSEMSSIVGVVNLDMFGYDRDQDSCIELHVGDMAASNTVGTCFANMINNYSLGLSHDFLTGLEALGASDHASFWNANVGAIEILENFSTNSASLGCQGTRDRNPSYHKRSDKIANMYLPATHRTVQAGVATVASMANPLGKCFPTDPVLSAEVQEESVLLSWQALPNAEVYKIYRGTKTCTGEMELIAEVNTNTYEDTDIVFDQAYFYKIVAAEVNGLCYSQVSNCVVVTVPTPEEPESYYYYYFPLTMTEE